MTPLDNEFELSKDSQLLTPVNSFKSQFCSPNKIPSQETGSSKTDSLTN